MQYIKLDTGILNSTLWTDRSARDIFITSLLMAVPYEFILPLQQYRIDGFKLTGFELPAGWYGFVEAAGPGIVRRALLSETEGMDALRRLGDPDPHSRSDAYEGRRMIRIGGGYAIINYMDYLLRDTKAAERVRRFRERKKLLAGEKDETLVTVTGLTVTQQCNHIDRDVNGDVTKNKTHTVRQAGRFDEFWAAYPKKVKRRPSQAIWSRKRLERHADIILADITSRLKDDDRWQRGFIPDPTTYLNQERWTDEITQPQENHHEPNSRLSAVDRVRDATAKRAKDRGET